MGLRNDWNMESNPRRSVTTYWRVIDGKRLSFTITQREVMQAGSIRAVERLIAEKAAAALETLRHGPDPEA